MLKYECPHCDEDLDGSFGDNVYCPDCNKSYETDWDYTSSDSIGCWLNGIEHVGKVDVEPLKE